MKLPLFRMTVEAFRIELRKSYLFKSYTTFSKVTSNKFGIEISLDPCACARCCQNSCLIAKEIYKWLKLKLSINSHSLVERFFCSGESNCMNSKCDLCSTPPQWEMMVQCLLKTRSHWMSQTMMLKRKLWHFLVGGKPNELKRYVLHWWKWSTGHMV